MVRYTCNKDKYNETGRKETTMKALDLNELYNVPARMEDIPLYVKKEDKKRRHSSLRV